MSDVSEAHPQTIASWSLALFSEFSLDCTSKSIRNSDLRWCENVRRQLLSLQEPDGQCACLSRVWRRQFGCQRDRERLFTHGAEVLVCKPRPVNRKEK